MNFSNSFFEMIVIASLILMSIGVISLLVMLVKDIKTKELW